MSRQPSRTLFFKRNQVRKRRVAIATASVVASITAATVFLCVRPAMTPAAAPLPLPASASVHVDQPERQAAATALAIASGALVTLADRHANDAVRMAGVDHESSADDLGWDYVQLRL